jgi:hypothetical protein
MCLNYVQTGKSEAINIIIFYTLSTVSEDMRERERKREKERENNGRELGIIILSGTCKWGHGSQLVVFKNR